MPHRIDLELTSARDDGTWTWRAAGARQPKGTLDGKILYDGAKVGDVMKAEAEFEIDGITILSVVPPRQKPSETGRLEIIGPPRDAGPGVTTSLVPKGQRGRRRDDEDGGRRERGGPGRERGGAETRDRRPGGPREGRPGGPREGRPGEDGRRRFEGAPGTRGRGREAGAPGEAGPRGRRGPGGPGSGERPGGRRPAEAAAPARPAPKRLAPGTKHRDAVLATLSPEHHPIAEQVLRGGIPAVRQAITAENEKAKAEGRPPINADTILAIAEELLPRLKSASWRDRAEAASAMLDEIGIRDLRSVVAGAEAVARDDETRLLASNLREALEHKLEAQRTSWVAEITTNLEEGRVVRALRLSGRPPDPSVRFPADLALKLAEAAGAAMSPDTPADRWAALLEAVAASPIRRNVKPAGLPPEPGEELLTAARQAAGRVPAMAALLGLPMPPPPGPMRTPPRPAGPRPGGRPPRPPAPAGSAPRPAAASEPAPAPADAPAVTTEPASGPTEGAPVAADPVDSAQAPAETAQAPAETAGAEASPAQAAEPQAEAPEVQPVAPEVQAEAAGTPAEAAPATDEGDLPGPG